eukprot:m.46636 g.46636  ORF g.46636 m.46636 type:complete len:72 (+) comp7280_c0_seq3:3347-3562(+)
MRGIVDDAIHIQVQTIKLWNFIDVCYLTETWVSFTHPAIILWNSHNDESTTVQTGLKINKKKPNNKEDEEQ